MSSFKKREKVFQKTHRERGQPSSRKKFGLLEKHKDYVLRAKSYHKKKAALKALHEKARNRNPEEFYFKMVNTKLTDGKHISDQPEEEYTEEQLQLMKTQDLKYIQMKLTSEEKKVERLQQMLHLTDEAGTQNSHLLFVDSDEESDVIEESTGASTSSDTKNEFSSGISGYREINQRLIRSRQLKRMAQRMQLQKHLLKKKERRIKIPGGDGIPVTYKWFQERKR